MSICAAGLTGTHPLDLARQLSQRDVLAAYYTALPPSRTRGVDPRLVRRHLALLAPIRVAMKAPRSQRILYRFIDAEFDRWMSRRLVPADVVHTVAGLGRRTRRAARRAGALAVCDSPTTHVRYQETIVTEECRKYGVPVAWDQQKIASMEAEYDESDLILVASTFARESFVARGVPAAKVAVVPYGVDLDEFKPAGARDDRFRVLFVGSLSVRKGLPYLLQAMSRFGWADAELVLRGEMVAESKDLLSSYAGRVPLRVIPPMPRGMLKHLYSSASVLVLPSIEDAFGLVIGQALACGTPVIATTHTGGPDIIEPGVDGFIIPPADADALAHALNTAYERRDVLAAMGRAARQRVEDARGWGLYGDRIVALFNDRVAASRAAGPG